MKSYYYACIESRLKYGVVFWGVSSLSIRVFRLQKKAIRTMAKVPKRTSCRNLFHSLGIMPLTTLYIYEVLVLIKSMESELQRNHDYHDYFTRRADDFSIPRHKLTIFENNPLFIGIKLFNFLDSSIRELSNIKTFKCKLKDYLIDKHYYSLDEFFNPLLQLLAYLHFLSEFFFLVFRYICC